MDVHEHVEDFRKGFKRIGLWTQDGKDEGYDSCAIQTGASSSSSKKKRDDKQDKDFQDRQINIYYYRSEDIEALERAVEAKRKCRPGEKRFVRPTPPLLDGQEQIRPAPKSDAECEQMSNEQDRECTE